MEDLNKAEDIWRNIAGELSMARSTVAYLWPVLHAANALLADVRRRHPGEELTCPFMRALDEAAKGGRRGP